MFTDIYSEKNLKEAKVKFQDQETGSRSSQDKESSLFQDKADGQLVEGNPAFHRQLVQDEAGSQPLQSENAEVIERATIAMHHLQTPS